MLLHDFFASGMLRISNDSTNRLFHLMVGEELEQMKINNEQDAFELGVRHGKIIVRFMKTLAFLAEATAIASTPFVAAHEVFDKSCLRCGIAVGVLGLLGLAFFLTINPSPWE